MYPFAVLPGKLKNHQLGIGIQFNMFRSQPDSLLQATMIAMYSAWLLVVMPMARETDFNRLPFSSLIVIPIAAWPGLREAPSV